MRRAAAKRRALAVAIAAGAWLGCAPFATRDPAAAAARHAEEGRLEEAVRAIEEVVRANPTDPALRRRAAAIHAKAGDVPRAIEHLEKGNELDPRDAEIWLDLAELERGRENIADAYVAYRHAARLDPESIRAVSGLALAADSLGFEAEANDAYARWSELERRARGED